MLTPQELQEQKAGLDKAVFGGYNVESVDSLLTTVDENYSALYQENAQLRSKLKLLAQKVEEYRAQENSIKNAMLKAQQTSEEILANAERKSAQMLSESEQRIRQRNQELSADVLAEQERVNLAKQSAARFVAELEEQIQAQLVQLEKIKQVNLSRRGDQVRQNTEKKPNGRRVQEKPSESPVAPAAPPASPAPEPSEVSAPGKPEQAVPEEKVTPPPTEQTPTAQREMGDTRAVPVIPVDESESPVMADTRDISESLTRILQASVSESGDIEPLE